MSTIALQRPDFSRTSRNGIRGYGNLQRVTSGWTMVSSKSTSARKEKEYSVKPQKLSIPEINKFSPPSIKFEGLHQLGDTAEVGQFVAREAQLDEEYWTAAWLRAESHWEDRENDRYAENYRRKFAEQEFNAMTKRYNAQLGEKCKCIVMVKKEDRNVNRTILKSVVGTLDLSIRYFSHGETFPGERVKLPLFCLINRKATSSYGYIANLCVAKSARLQGIASSMMQYAILSAKAHGAEKVFVHVHRNNKPAQGLYKKMGFQVVDAASSQLSADQTYLLCFEASATYDVHFPFICEGL